MNRKKIFRPWSLVLGILSVMGSIAPIHGQVVTPTVQPVKKALSQSRVSQAKTPLVAASVTAVATPKGFQWFLKNGCNCAQCRAARQQQADDQERLKETFQP